MSNEQGAHLGCCVVIAMGTAPDSGGIGAGTCTDQPARLGEADDGRHARVAAILSRARQDHAALRAVQSEILTLEARITGNVAALGVSTEPPR